MKKTIITSVLLLLVSVAFASPAVESAPFKHSVPTTFLLGENPDTYLRLTHTNNKFDVPFALSAQEYKIKGAYAFSDKLGIVTEINIQDLSQPDTSLDYRHLRRIKTGINYVYKQNKKSTHGLYVGTTYVPTLNRIGFSSLTVLNLHSINTYKLHDRITTSFIVGYNHDFGDEISTYTLGATASIKLHSKLHLGIEYIKTNRFNSSSVGFEAIQTSLTYKATKKIDAIISYNNNLDNTPRTIKSAVNIGMQYNW